MTYNHKPYPQRLQDYEREKQALYSKGLSGYEFLQAIKELAKKHRV